MNARHTTKSSFIRGFGALFALSLATACQPDWDDTEPVPEPPPAQLSLRMERGAGSPRFSWEGGKLHRFEVIECSEPSKQEEVETCSCSGHLVWGLGAADSEPFHEVALEQPFIESPVEYDVRPASDRKGYDARPLVAGRTYLARAVQVGPCPENAENCQRMTALGCQRFVW
ncbi:hypothetical protein JQX13_31435 [Archangium violaceum]|uniref:hypothetical protein n=1 Tax=Archangium violaceum TaxID=83451 RepID=UPI00193B0EAB|nr:hypothetical protein [Archangium violaceum]QRK04732.1 hypothetical protein JQX13_31435 [Archangium violaceum]